MRKKLLAFACIAIIAACKQSLTEPSMAVETENAKATALLNMQDATAQRQAFTLLTPAEKAAVWQQHFVGFVDSHVLNEQQLLLIEELKGIAVAKNFGSEKAAAIVEVKFAKPWMKIAEENFTGIEIIELVLELKSVNSNNVIAGKRTEEYCQCAVGSLFTCWSSSGASGPSFEQCTLITACHVTYPDDSQILDSDGCGFLMMSSCNGNHCDITNNPT